MTRRIRNFLAALLLTAVYWTYSRLWFFRRFRIPAVVKQGGPVVYAHWHGDELLLVGAHVGTGISVMASRSRDGELMGTVLRWLGYSVVRGSSSRGGAGGLKGLIDKVAKEKRSASIAVDGPRGPVYKVKPGIIKLAQQTGAYLVPGAAAASRRFVFKKAWNRCYLPFPLAKCLIVYGEPIKVPRDLSDEEFEQYRLGLELQLLRLKEEAEEFFQRRGEVRWLKSTVS